MFDSVRNYRKLMFAGALLLGPAAMLTNSRELRGAGTAATEVAQNDTEVETPTVELLSGEASYLGPVLDDRAYEERTFIRRSQAGGLIDPYNVWASFQRITMKSDFSLRGHAYQICSNRHPSFYLGNLIFFGGTSGQVRITYNFSKAARGKATGDYDLNAPGFWLLSGELKTSDFPPGYYKVVAKYAVERGGAGSGKETAFLDILNCS